MWQVAALRGVLRKKIVSDLIFTAGGRAAQMALALVGSIVSARTLGPVEFGRFGLVIAVITICGTLADAGLSYTCVKLISQYVAGERERAASIARAYFVLRLLTGAVVAILGFALSEPIASLVLGQSSLAPLIQIAFGTLLSLSISSYPGTILIGLGLFGRLGIAGVLNAGITVAGILALYLSGNLNLGTLVAWNVVLPLLSSLPAWFMLPAAWRPFRNYELRREENVKGRWLLDREVVVEMVRFSKWMGIAGVGTVVAGQVDLILLGRIADAALVGVYSVALTLALRLDIVNQSLLTVMLPRASRLRNRQEVKQYTRRTFLGSLVLAMLLGVAVLAAQPIITLLYGERYSASAGLFMALTVVVLFDLVTSSLFLVALPLNRPRLLATGDWLRVGILGSVGWVLIPKYGGYGAVATRLVARVLGAIYTFAALRRMISSRVEDGEGEEHTAASWPL